MKEQGKNLFNILLYAFVILMFSFVVIGCSYEHEGKIVKDTEGRIYKLEGSNRINETYFLIPVDTVDYKSKFN